MNDFIDLHHLITVVLRKWWLLLSITVLAALAGYAYSQRQTPVYEATATVLVGQIFQSSSIDRQEILTSELVAQTYLDLARRQPILQSVIDTLNLTESWQQLRRRVSVELIDGTQLIQITVEASSPTTAQIIADQLARQMILFSPAASGIDQQQEVNAFVEDELANLQGRIQAGQDQLVNLIDEIASDPPADRLVQLQAEVSNLEGLITNWENTYIQLLNYAQTGQSPNSLTIIEPAQPNPQPVSPQTQLNVILAASLGIFLALGIIFVLESLDDSLKTSEEVARAFGLPVLGKIHDTKRLKDAEDGVYVVKYPRSPLAESYRFLRANLDLIEVNHPLKSILITSCEKGVGKSTVSTSLAMIMAQAERRIFLVDADLRNASIHTMVGVPNELGLSDLLEKDMPIQEAMLCSNGTMSCVIPSGAPPLNPSELLSSVKMDRILNNLSELADTVIIDAPPLYISDAVILANKVDGVLLVVRLGHTRKKHVQQTLEQLYHGGASVIGIVLTGVTGPEKEYYRAYESMNGNGKVAQNNEQAPQLSWSKALPKNGKH